MSDGFRTANFNATATPSGGSYGRTDYTLGFTFEQLSGYPIGEIATVSAAFNGSATKVPGDVVGAEWCSSFGCTPDRVGILASNGATYSFSTIDTVIENTAGPSGGYIVASASDLVSNVFTAPFDEPGDCAVGRFTYNDGGFWGALYFEENYIFKNLTVNDWYCLAITYEFRAFGSADWSGSWEVVVYAGFQATAVTDGPGWLGPGTSVAWNTEWRVKGYTFTNTGGSLACPGMGPPPPL